MSTINRSKINFCHIAPTNYLHLVEGYKTHLLLAHLVEEDEAYRNFYINLKRQDPKVFYHLDNSAFEMFKRGQPMYSTDKLLKMAELVHADSIVMSDYPKENWKKTVEAAADLIPKFKDAGFKTFFCPQSELGDIDGLLQSFRWGILNSGVDFIGVSILACPIALGVDEQSHHDVTQRSETYRLQRYLSRWAVFNHLDRMGLLNNFTHKRFHCLGMTDGPKEVSLLAPFSEHIYSWDSSSPIWHGINNISYDSSPTGLQHGKHEKEVDFNQPYDYHHLSRIRINMTAIDNMCGGLI